MINEILDYTSIELGEITLDRSDFSVRALLERVRDQFAGLAADKSVTITIDCDYHLIAHADEKRMLQILINLCANALKFAKAHEITLRARRTATGFDIEVQDDGCGIPQPAHSLIFNAFQQIEASHNRSEGGAGLGLAICKTLAAAHGGQISVRSAEGEGATFTVSLPHNAIAYTSANATKIRKNLDNLQLPG
jgi:signal transduction histidine kinase